jgi:hypothetical protein
LVLDGSSRLGFKPDPAHRKFRNLAAKGHPDIPGRRKRRPRPRFRAGAAPFDVVLAPRRRLTVLSSTSPCALAGVTSERPPRELPPDPWVPRSSRIHGMSPKRAANDRTHGAVIGSPGRWLSFARGGEDTDGPTGREPAENRRTRPHGRGCAWEWRGRPASWSRKVSARRGGDGPTTSWNGSSPSGSQFEEFTARFSKLRLQTDSLVAAVVDRADRRVNPGPVLSRTSVGQRGPRPM